MLSDQERRQLDEIERQLTIDDPALGRTAVRIMKLLERRRGWLRRRLPFLPRRSWMVAAIVVVLVVASAAVTVALL